MTQDTKTMLDLVRANQLPSSTRSWLGAPDTTTNFDENAKKRVPHTGLWFVEGPQFSAWLEEPHALLLISGPAGCGKSILCSTAIEHAFRHCQANPGVGIAFFFFAFADNDKVDASSMLRALILQLSSQLDDDNYLITTLQERYYPVSLTQQLLVHCLHSILREFNKVLIILDAPNESSKGNHRAEVLPVLVQLRSWSHLDLHMIISSRDEANICKDLNLADEEIIKMDHVVVEPDIASFVSHHLRHDQRLQKWENHHGHIRTVLSQRAQGIFSWVEGQLPALANCPPSEDHLEKRLETLPLSLEETYERVLTNIPVAIRVDAKRMLTLLCCARRPLTVAELTGGMAVEVVSRPAFNSKRLLRDIDAIQEGCPGLTESTEDSGDTTVRISHISVQEYLESDRICESQGAAFFSVRKSRADANMACICLTVLLQPDPTSFALARYAACHWWCHYLGGAANPIVDAQASHLFHGSAFQTWLSIWQGEGFDDTLVEGRSPLFVASLLGLDHIVQSLCADIKPEVKDHGNALQAASGEGHLRVVQQLLSDGADVNVRGGEFGDALYRASFKGHDAVVKLLLDRDADVKAHSGDYGTALQAASAEGHSGIVKLLLGKGADVNAQDGFYGTALQAASSRGYFVIVQQLLEMGADVDTAGGEYGNALQAAAAVGEFSVVQLLLDKGADVDGLRCERSDTALQAASAGRHYEIVQLLLDRGAVVNRERGFYCTALQAASAGGHSGIVQLLLGMGADVNVQGGCYGTALQAASGKGHHKIVELLLDIGADVNVEYVCYGTALEEASAGGHYEIVKLLLDRDAQHNTALHKASMNGHYEVVGLLLDRGVDVNAQDGNYGTALQAASKERQRGIVKLLLKRGADRKINTDQHVKVFNVKRPRDTTTETGQMDRVPKRGRPYY